MCCFPQYTFLPCCGGAPRLLRLDASAHHQRTSDLRAFERVLLAVTEEFARACPPPPGQSWGSSKRESEESKQGRGSGGREAPLPLSSRRAPQVLHACSGVVWPGWSERAPVDNPQREWDVPQKTPVLLPFPILYRRLPLPSSFPLARWVRAEVYISGAEPRARLRAYLHAAMRGSSLSPAAISPTPSCSSASLSPPSPLLGTVGAADLPTCLLEQQLVVAGFVASHTVPAVDIAHFAVLGSRKHPRQRVAHSSIGRKGSERRKERHCCPTLLCAFVNFPAHVTLLQIQIEPSELKSNCCIPHCPYPVIPSTHSPARRPGRAPRDPVAAPLRPLSSCSSSSCSLPYAPRHRACRSCRTRLAAMAPGGAKPDRRDAGSRGRSGEGV